MVNVVLFPSFDKDRLALSRPAIEVPGVLDGVSVDLLHQHGHIVPADNFYRLSLDRLVVPAGALSFGTGFIHW